MILDIVKYPNKILTRKTKRVVKIDNEIEKLIGDMVETLYAKKGAGLAANQVGSDKRIFLADDSRSGSNLMVLINPKITKKKGELVMSEGCLSFPGLWLDIKRPAKIEVEYMDKNGQQKKIKASDLLARIISHESDHLDGKTMLDRLPLFTRLKLKRQLRKNKVLI